MLLLGGIPAFTRQTVVAQGGRYQRPPWARFWSSKPMAVSRMLGLSFLAHPSCGPFSLPHQATAMTSEAAF